MAKEKLTTITRSFSYKHNLGNYQSCDFFACQSVEVPESEAEATSEKLYQFCKAQVSKSLAEYLKTGIETPQAPVTLNGIMHEPSYAKGFEKGWQEAKKPPKQSLEAEEKKEVGAEIAMDNKSEG